MRIAVAGGTGVVGRCVAASLSAAGHEPVVLARSTGVDLTTGVGLDAGLAGVEAVIDVSNISTTSGEKSVAFFTAATSNLVQASARARVKHLVALSIVGIDRVDFGYYEGKRQQESLLANGDVPYSVLRATQFHEFAGQVLERMKGPIAVIPRMRCQPVAAAEVADALATLAAGAAVGRVPDLAGPRVEELTEMARAVLRRQASRRLLLPVPMPGAAGRAMASGELLPTEPGPRGVQTFAQWLAAS